jgi:uncharacterized protein (DUF2267 family)
MSATGLTAFDNTIHTTNAWLQDLMERLGWGDRHYAYIALRAVLHALRDRLSIEEAADLSAQLPMLVRGFYYEGWHPHGKPTKDRKKEDFLERVVSGFDKYPIDDPEEVVQAVFETLSTHITPGEVEDVKNALPADIRKLWP